MRRLLYLVAALALLVPAAVQPAMAQQQPQDLTINALQGEPDNIDPNRSSFNTRPRSSARFSSHCFGSIHG